MLQITVQTLVTAFFAFLLPFVSMIILTPLLIKKLSKRGSLVHDYHKPNKPLVPKPGGPAIFISLILGESIVYLLTGANGALALILVTAIAGAIGILDDIYTLSGVLKPVLLIMASFPILILGAYNFHIEFPIFGDVRLSVIYPIWLLSIYGIIN